MKRYVLTGILVSLSIITLFISPNIPIILISIYLLYWYNNTLNISLLQSSKLFNIIVSAVTYVLFLGLITLGSWLLSHEFPLRFTPLLSLSILIATHVWQSLFSQNTADKNTRQQISFFNANDFWSLLVATTITSVIVLSSFISVAGGNVRPYFGLVNGNVDDAPHIGMINERIQFDRGVLLHATVQSESRFGSAGISYPIAWHAANATLIKSISPQIKTGEQTILYYALLKTVWFFILIFLMTRISFFILPSLSKSKKQDPLGVAWVLTSTLLFGFLFLVDIYRDGFFSFIPQLISALVLCVYLAALMSKKNVKGKLSILPIVGIVGIGGALSWVLILPALFMFIVGVVFYSLRQRTFSSTIKYMTPALAKEFTSSVLIYLTLSAALFVQLYVMRFSASPLSFKESIVLPGGVAVYNDMFYVFLYIGVLSALVITPKLRKLSLALIYSAASVLLLAGVIFLIQLVLVGRTEYYYYKILHVATVTLIPLAIYGYYLLLKKVSMKSQFAAFSAILFLVMIIGQSAGKANVETFQYLSGERKISQATLVATQSLIEKNSDTPYNAREVYIFDTALVDTHEIGTMLVKNDSPYSRCFTNLTDNYRYGRDASKTIAIVQQSCKVPVTIITTPESALELKNEAEKMNIDVAKFRAKTLVDFK